MPELIHVTGAAGLDEAGRGPLAGPVVAAAVIIVEGFSLTGINDSKKLTREQRGAMAIRIRSECIFAVAVVGHEIIDEINILWASMRAMELALDGLSQAPACIYVDGNRVPRQLEGRAEAVIKGDGIYACIAAASILAKTTRDAHMVEMANEYPEYGFDRHFGYPTPDHFEALERHGPCAIHRRSFAPIGGNQPSLF